MHTVTARAVDAASGGMPPRRLRLLEWLQITQCLGGKQLACGCVTGIYQTSSGIVLTVVDGPGVECPHADHRQHWVLAERATRLGGGDARQPG
jgi:hypothetical protein